MAGAPPDLAGQIERYLTRELGKQFTIEDGPAMAEDAARFILSLSAADYAAGAGVGILAAAEAATGAFFAVLALIVIEIAFIITVSFVWILDRLYDALPNISIWGQGIRLRDHLPRPSDFVSGVIIWMAKTGAQFARTFFHALIALVSFGISFNPTGAKTIITAQIEQIVNPVHHEVDALWGWVNSINNEVQYLAHHFPPAPPPTGPSPIPLRDRVTRLELQQAHQAAQIEDLQDSRASQQAQIAQLAGDFAALGASVHGVRAVGIGWQDIELQLERLRSTVEVTQASIDAQLAVDAARLSELEPLGLLMTNGARGIDNLVTLSNDMCQCPRLPNIPDALPEALAALTFIKDG